MDMAGNTPLHVAINAGMLEAVRILAQEGQADPTKVNMWTRWQPIHLAAALGQLEMCKVLIQRGCPLRPQVERRGDLPSDLARANGHTDLADFLDNVIEKTRSSSSQWLHGNMSRQEAEAALRRAGNRRSGSVYLIRKSTNFLNTFTLSMLYGNHPGEIRHYIIFRRGIYYLMNKGPLMPSLEHLVDYYTQ